MSLAFADWLWLHHHLRPDEVEPSNTPGYWRIIELCGGRSGGCRHPVHRCLFREGPTHHTVQYLDPRRDEKGRFVSPYRTWKQAREEYLQRNKNRSTWKSLDWRGKDEEGALW